MEPASIPAQRGTLEDPEILQNVPGHVIAILQREFDDFKTEATKFLEGQTEEDEFIKFRLKQGVYGQRQADVQMIRVKLPFGGITPEQMEKFADVIERYVPLRNLPASDLKSSYSRSRIGITCPGTFWRISGSSSVPRCAGMETGSITKPPEPAGPADGDGAAGGEDRLRSKPSGFQVFIQGSDASHSSSLLTPSRIAARRH